MTDRRGALALSALVVLSAVALAGTTAARSSAGDAAVGDAGAALQADGQVVQQVEPGETMVVSGTTTLSPGENAVTVEVTGGPSADAFEPVTVDEWAGDTWTAEVPVPADAEPGTYTAEVTVGQATTTLQFEVVAQQAAVANETAAVGDDETGVAAGDNETVTPANETTEEGIEAGALDNETNETTGADDEALVVNETEQPGNETAAMQVEAGETLVVSGTTTLSPENNSIVLEVTGGPGAAVFEPVTVDDWGDDGNWTAEVPVPTGIEPGTYLLQVNVGNATTTMEFEVVAQQAVQANETTAANETETPVVGDNETTEEDGVAVGDNETATTTEEAAVGANETETTTTEEEPAVGNETETTTEEEPAAGVNETNDTGDIPEEQPAEETTTPGQPGFGLAVALAALVASLLVLARRRR